MASTKYLLKYERYEKRKKKNMEKSRRGKQVRNEVTKAVPLL